MYCFKIPHTQTGFFINRKISPLPSVPGRSSPEGKKHHPPLPEDNSPTIPTRGEPAESVPSPPPAELWRECHLRTWTRINQDLHNLDSDLTPARDASQKLTLWKPLEMNYHWSFLDFFGDTLYQSITTFYKCYSIMKDFRDYVNQDKSTGDTFLNRMRFSSFLFFSPSREKKVAQFKCSGH